MRRLDEPPCSDAMPGKRAGLALLAALVLGAVVRVVLPWPAVVSEHGILPLGGADEFYHLRQIEYSVENFPAVLSDDASVNAPDVGEIVWPPLWDLGIAASTLPLGARGDRERLEAVVPPIVGHDRRSESTAAPCWRASAGANDRGPAPNVSDESRACCRRRRAPASAYPSQPGWRPRSRAAG